MDRLTSLTAFVRVVDSGGLNDTVISSALITGAFAGIESYTYTPMDGKRVPMVLGFDPLFQFLHEDDMVRAILLTLEKRPRGVYNVAGPQPLPLSRVVREAGRVPVPLPELQTEASDR